YFDAYSFVLARAQEYEADQYSVDTAGKTVAGRALAHLQLKARSLQDEHWPAFYRQAADQPQAPRNTFAPMLAASEQPIAQTKVEHWLRDELRIKTGYDNTHPALADRLQGIGFSQEIVAGDSILQALELQNSSYKETAAQHYLNEIPADVTDR